MDKERLESIQSAAKSVKFLNWLVVDLMICLRDRYQRIWDSAHAYPTITTPNVVVADQEILTILDNDSSPIPQSAILNIKVSYARELLPGKEPHTFSAGLSGHYLFDVVILDTYNNIKWQDVVGITIGQEAQTANAFGVWLYENFVKKAMEDHKEAMEG